MAARKTAKRTTKRKTTAKRSTRKTAAKRKPAATRSRRTTAKRKQPAVKKRTTAIRAPYSKSQTLAEIADLTDVAKKDVSAVLEALGDIINRHVKPGAAGQFTLPGLAKVVVQHKKATKARKGINPFTGEPTIFKAKPARNIVKVRPLKKLKEMAAK